MHGPGGHGPMGGPRGGMGGPMGGMGGPHGGMGRPGGHFGGGRPPMPPRRFRGYRPGCMGGCLPGCLMYVIGAAALIGVILSIIF